MWFKWFKRKPRWVRCLPEWATYNPKGGFVEVKPSVVYPLYYKKLGYGKLTYNGLETARHCFTEDLFHITGSGLRLRILKDPKYRLTKYPMGIYIEWHREYSRIKRIEREE